MGEIDKQQVKRLTYSYLETISERKKFAFFLTREICHKISLAHQGAKKNEQRSSPFFLSVERKGCAEEREVQRRSIEFAMADTKLVNVKSQRNGRSIKTWYLREAGLTFDPPVTSPYITSSSNGKKKCCQHPKHYFTSVNWGKKLITFVTLPGLSRACSSSSIPIGQETSTAPPCRSVSAKKSNLVSIPLMKEICLC